MNNGIGGGASVSEGQTFRITRTGGSGALRGGAVYGAAAVLGWTCFCVGSTASLSRGLRPEDLTMLRYGVSALVCAPWLIRAGRANARSLGWVRAFLLALAAGPLFGTLVNAAMLFAPLSHTAVMVQAVSMLGGMVLGRLWLHESVTRSRWAGAAVMAVALTWLMLQGTRSATGTHAWIGDILFVAAGALWTSYTFMLRRWNLDPMLAVSAVNVISGVLYFPVYLLLIHGQFPSVGWVALGEAAVVQGVVAAFLTVYAYAQTVRLLGAARAAVLPAAVAPLTVLLGTVLLGEFPTSQQIAALALAMTGFTGAVGLWQGRQRRFAAR